VVEVVKIMPTLALPLKRTIEIMTIIRSDYIVTETAFVAFCCSLLPKALVLAVLLILTCMNLTRSLILTSAVMLSLILLGEVFLLEVKR